MAEQLAYSQRQAAALLGVSVSHFQRHIRKELPEDATKFIGGRIVFTHAGLAHYLEHA